MISQCETCFRDQEVLGLRSNITNFDRQFEAHDIIIVPTGVGSGSWRFMFGVRNYTGVGMICSQYS